MLFLIESIVLCALFTALVCTSLLKDPLAWISDYPPAIQQRAKELGLISAEKKFITRAEAIRKAVGSVVMAVLLSLILQKFNGVSTFGQGFLLSYGLWSVVTWYDALVIDCLWFCHSKKVILPGTEDMTDSYKDYLFHIRQSLIGMALGLPVCLLVGLCVTLLPG